MMLGRLAGLTLPIVDNVYDNPMLEGKIARLVETVTQIAVEHGHPVDALRRQAAALHDLGPAATPRLRGQRV